MEAVIDSSGRILLPKVFRDALGLVPGTTVDVSFAGSGVQLTPGGRTARLVTAEDGQPAAQSDTPITDEILFSLIDSGRR